MTKPTVWQIACGEAGRRYDDLFLEHDIMFLGPGRLGQYSRETYAAAVDDGRITNDECNRVARFHKRVKEGDFVLVRAGHRVVGIGVVASDYGHDDRFDDIHGWDLQHFRRVTWQQQFQEELEQIQEAEGNMFSHMKQISTFTGLNSLRVRERIEHFLPQCVERELADLPPLPPEPLSLEEIGEALFEMGLSFDVVQRVKTALEKQRGLLNWYQHPRVAPRRPREHEVVAHLVLPILLALGWSEQFLAVEWNKVDLAVFGGTPTDGAHCKMICEAKGMGQGLQGALKQAKTYASKLSLESCRRILLTTGGRFFLYKREGDAWNDEPAGYLNVLKMRRSHVCPAETDAVQTLVDLTPAAINE